MRGICGIMTDFSWGLTIREQNVLIGTKNISKTSEWELSISHIQRAQVAHKLEMQLVIKQENKKSNNIGEVRNELICVLKHNKPIQELYIVIMSFVPKVGGASLKTDDKLVLFVSFMGKNFNDSPKVLYDYIDIWLSLLVR